MYICSTKYFLKVDMYIIAQLCPSLNIMHMFRCAEGGMC